VVIEPVEFPWPAVGNGWEEDNRNARTRVMVLSSSLSTAGEEEEARERLLGQSAAEVCVALARLLEAAIKHHLVTVALAEAILNSPLLDDDRLQRDQRSLGHIATAIHPLLVPLPLTPVENVELPAAGSVGGYGGDNDSSAPFSTCASSHCNCHMQLPW